MTPANELTGLLAALGIGLLIGIERERSKGEGSTRGSAGVRTFCLLALGGAVAALLGGVGIAVAGGFVALAALASYRQTRANDPGLTSEVSMLLVFLLGVLAMQEAALAAGVGVVVAILLASKTWLHRLVRHLLSAQELHDGLLLAAAAAIVLPLLPDRAIDPWQVLNPRKLWLLAVLVMVINTTGHVALRMLGARLGLMLAGFAGGFVSSTATIASMGSKSREVPALASNCAAAGVLSNLSTVVQLALVTGMLSPPLLKQLALPLLAAAAVALGFSLFAGWHSARTDGTDGSSLTGRAFKPLQVLMFVAIVAAVMLFSAIIRDAVGKGALVWTLAASGLADVHAAAASAAQFVGLGRMDLQSATLAILFAFAANSASKLVVAFLTGGRRYGLRLLPGIVGMLAAFAVVVVLF
ncbi:MAG: DUF4010 domain-containing protein [Burkholderiaceae bacterium]